jgi:F420-0:gamma-glutamyl ligase-like protein
MVKIRLKKYRTITPRSRYWKPHTDYKMILQNLLRDRIHDDDVIVISEKALATAAGRICDESKYRPCMLAKILAGFWVRKIWGYFLAPISRMSKKNISRLRQYPFKEGSRHKQVTLHYAGFLQSLRHGSEGGIDVSNLPYTYSCIPFMHPEMIASDIKRHIKKILNKNVDVMMSDSDKSYSFFNFHLSASVKGIHCFGILAFILGRFFKLKPRSTPIAFTRYEKNPEEALRLAAISNKSRGDGAGRTIWDVAELFGVDITGVTWNMLENMPHYPIVILRIEGNSIQIN